jgi:menaquinone-dependent protoporphyrinogen oxidase
MSAVADARVLGAYATRHGSTRETAQRIADRLSERALPVTVAAVAHADDVAAYTAVVLGSPVYDGRWLPEADDFAERHNGVLAERAVWLFSVGAFGDTKRLIGPAMRREPRNIADLRRALRPAGYRVFAGVIERGMWPLRGRMVLHAFGGRLGDHRDWSVVDAWAQEIADRIHGTAPA